MTELNAADSLTQASRVNIKLRPNVICTQLYAWDETERALSLNDDQLKSRIAYWELLEFSRQCTFRFSSVDHRRDRLNRRQQQEMEWFLDLGPGVRHLWPGDTRQQFEPFPVSCVTHPFFEQWSDRSKQGAGFRTKETFTRGNAKPEILSGGFIGSEVYPEIDKPSDQLTEESQILSEANEQERVIRAPVYLHQIVLAPPGTGKTYVLVKRLAELVANHGVENPALEVLVLSFSRAAVAEVTRRLEAAVKDGAHDDLRYVQVRTFDSYATRMLTRGESEVPGLASGYQTRIRKFCQSLREGTLPEAAQEELASLRFLIIDEVQDLVGDRAHMALQMMAFVRQQGGYVLLLGDPAQAIYDWQLPENDPMNSVEFLRSARCILAQNTDCFQEIPLKHYRRFVNFELLEFVHRCREAVGDDGREPDRTRLTNQLQSLANLPLKQLTGVVSSEERVAILTRTNLEAYQISRWCSEQGIVHRVERGSSGRYWPGWIARLCLGYRMERMTLNIARQLWDRKVANREAASFEHAREYLRHHGLCGNDVLDLCELSDLIQKSQPQCHWPLMKETGLTISTIHRSKGLEFDRILLLKARPEDFNAGDDDQGQEGEARVLYVAATRARRNITMLLRDDEILRKGNKYCKGFPWNKLNHFHLYESRQGANFLLLNGLDEFDQLDFLQSVSGQSVLETQDEIWEDCSKGSPSLCARRVDSVLSWQLPSGRRLCALDGDLQASLQQLGTTFRRKATAVSSIRNVPVVDVATVSFVWEGGHSLERYLGTARLVMLPVVYGLALVALD